MRVLVEESADDAGAVAQLLAAEGHDVSVLDLDAAVAHRLEADIAYLDLWTPDTAPRVAALRARGVRLSCSSELLLERARKVGARSVGITGSAGKSTTAALTVQLLGAAGLPVRASDTARLGNLWASEELVAGTPGLRQADVLVLELTSSHLAFMSSSPDVAVMTCYWPDHVELHGSEAAYRAAKETIVRHQPLMGSVVLNDDDPVARSLATLTPARRYAFSALGEVEEGAFLRDGAVVVRRNRAEAVLGPPPPSPTLRQATLAACATAVAAGADLDALGGTLQYLVPPPHRQEPLGRVQGALVVDDGMAVTPPKARAALSAYADDSVILIAGGRRSTVAGEAHASPVERIALGAFCDEAARAVRRAILFGDVASFLECKLAPRGVITRLVDTLETAATVAVESAPGSEVVLFAPVYPLSAEERVAFRSFVRAAAGGSLVRDSRA
jgi:UDP-N-acetylmuramoylalanine--D-glutamate ligase